MTSGVHPAWPHLWSHLWSLEGKKGTFMTASAVEEIRGLPSFTSVANLETTEQSMLPQGATLLHAASAGADPLPQAMPAAAGNNPHLQPLCSALHASRTSTSEASLWVRRPA